MWSDWRQVEQCHGFPYTARSTLGYAVGPMDLPRKMLSVDEAAAAVEAAVRARLVKGYVDLVQATEVAINTLVYVAQHGRHEEARVRAAAEILDRAHLTAETRAAIDAQPESQVRAEELRRKLDSMQQALLAPIDVAVEEAG